MTIINHCVTTIYYHATIINYYLFRAYVRLSIVVVIDQKRYLRYFYIFKKEAESITIFYITRAHPHLPKFVFIC